MKTRLLNYLHFSRNERFGAFALLTLCIITFCTPAVLQWLRPKRHTDFSEFAAVIKAFKQSSGTAESGRKQCFDFDPNLATMEDFRQLGLPEKVASNICHYREKGGAFRKAEDFQKIWGLPAEDYERLLPYLRISVEKKEAQPENAASRPPEYFPFDPNTATEADFLRLGLPGRTIKSILNYREKGGSFRKKEDFAKIYTLSESDYRQLEPYIVFAPRPGSYVGRDNKPAASGAPVDINLADATALMSLPLIGEKRAQQIIAFREKLGGFRTVDQLSEMFGLPDSVYQRIRPRLCATATSVHKINLNTVTREALDAHPYISWKQADLIIAYRNQHGNYTRPEEILNIKAFGDKAWWEKISPYLDVE